jgi:hypothetical protein
MVPNLGPNLIKFGIYIFPKWRNFAKSGHRGSEREWQYGMDERKKEFWLEAFEDKKNKEK